MTHIAFQELRTNELLKIHANLMDELRLRGVLRTMNNPVAGYAEYLACKALSLKAAPNSEKGFDAVGIDGAKYEIKSRRVAMGSSPTRFSAIRDIEGHHFDFLIAIIFESDFTIKSAWLMPYDLVLNKSKFQMHTHAWILPARKSSWNDSSAIDLTSKFVEALDMEIT